jgi:acyl-CoA reductase-like NAD-dependent aldehyde dehydrogenase
MNSITTTNPATEEHLEAYPKMSDAQVQQAIEGCHEAFLDWRRQPIDRRADVLRGLGEGLHEHRSQLASQMTREMGKLLEQTVEEIDLCAAIFHYEAEHGAAALTGEQRDLVTGGSGRISYAPIGLVYGIQPWNFPAYQVVRYAAASLAAMSEVRHGDPCDEEVQLGPIARQDLREKLHQQVQESVAKGASVSCGGSIPDGRGFFYPATVLEAVESGQPAFDDELFGPVASLIRARDNQHAMQLANDSRFGLGGGIFSADEATAIELAEQHFDTGMVFINRFGLADPAMPFGGVKNSGYGREHGGFGTREFVNIKSVMRGSS